MKKQKGVKELGERKCKSCLTAVICLTTMLCTGCGNGSVTQDELQYDITPSQSAGSGPVLGNDTDLAQSADNGTNLENDADTGAESGQTPGADGTGLENDTATGIDVGQGTSAQAEDHVFQTWEAPLADGRILRLEAVGKQVNEYMFGVREVRVYDGDTLIQTVLSSEGYWHEDYTECWSEESAVEILDLNFDGSTDFGLFGWVTNNYIPFYYWIWDEGEGCYRYAGTLQGVELDPEAKEAACSTRDGWGVYFTDYYRPNADGELLFVRREKSDYREMDLTDSGGYEGDGITDTWIPEEGVEILSTDEEIPEEALVLISRRVLIKEVHDDDVSYFEEIWELKDGELQMINREEIFEWNDL